MAVKNDLNKSAEKKPSKKIWRAGSVDQTTVYPEKPVVLNNDSWGTTRISVIWYRTLVLKHHIIADISPQPTIVLNRLSRMMSSLRRFQKTTWNSLNSSKQLAKGLHTFCKCKSYVEACSSIQVTIADDKSMLFRRTGFHYDRATTILIKMVSHIPYRIVEGY